jgi:hypothetical protein
MAPTFAMCSIASWLLSANTSRSCAISAASPGIYTFCLSQLWDGAITLVTQEVYLLKRWLRHHPHLRLWTGDAIPPTHPDHLFWAFLHPPSTMVWQLPSVTRSWRGWKTLCGMKPIFPNTWVAWGETRIHMGLLFKMHVIISTATDSKFLGGGCSCCDRLSSPASHCLRFNPGPEHFQQVNLL